LDTVRTLRGYSVEAQGLVETRVIKYVPEPTEDLTISPRLIGLHSALGGVSFWLPGFFGSLAAAPQQPGWSLTSIYYHTSVSAGADVARAREITIGRIPAEP